MVKEGELTSLLLITEAFLIENGFTKTVTQLHKETEKRSLKLPAKNNVTSLSKIYTSWLQSQNASLLSDASSSDSSSSEDESSSDASDSESSSNSSSDDNASGGVEVKRGVKRKRTIVAATTSAESSEVSSSSDSESESSEDEARLVTKKVTVAEKVKPAPSKDIIKVSSAEESEDEEEEEEDDDSESSVSEDKNVSSIGPSKSTSATEVDSSDSSSASSSDSGSSDSSSSDSSSDSDSDSDSSTSSVKSAKAKARKPSKTAQKVPAFTTPKAAAQGDTSPSSATLSGSPVSKATVTTISVAETSMHPSRKRKLDNSSITLAAVPTLESEASDLNGTTEEVAKRAKKNNIPFSRIPSNQYVDPKLASNKFVPYDYAQRAHEKLIVTKGKGFTKEKNKGKRGSYRGGKIDLSAKGIKFED